MRHNILITSAGKWVALTRYFKETLDRLYPDAKVFTTDMNPEMAPAGYVSDGCFKVPRVTDVSYPDLLLEICDKHSSGMVIATIDTELLILADLKHYRSTGTCASDKSISLRFFCVCCFAFYKSKEFRRLFSLSTQTHFLKQYPGAKNRLGYDSVSTGEGVTAAGIYALRLLRTEAA